MNPKVKEKLSGMAGEKGIDLSVIMGTATPSLDTPILEEGLMPDISAESVYESIAEQFAPLDSDEVLQVIHLILMNRSTALED